MTIALNSCYACPTCGGHSCISNGFLICRECGLVLEREIRNSYFTMGKSKEIPTQQYVGGIYHMCAQIEGSYVGSNSLFSEDMKRKASSSSSRLKWMQIRYTRTSAIDRNVRILRELWHISSILEIPKQALMRTATILKKALPLWRKNGYTMAAVALLQALREYTIPILESEILDLFNARGSNISVKQMIKARRFLWETLKLKHLTLSPLYFLPRVITALQSDSSLLEKLSEKEIDPIRFFQDLERSARQQLQKLHFHDKGARRPFTLAASCCYAMSRHIGYGILLTQAIAGNACKSHEYSVRDHYNTLWKPLLAKEG